MAIGHRSLGFRLGVSDIRLFGGGAKHPHSSFH
jgi:hypothetical protein